MQPYCHAIGDTKKNVNLLLTFIAGHELMVTVLIVSNKWAQVLPVQCKMECNVSSFYIVKVHLTTIFSDNIVNFPFYAMDLAEFV